MFIRLDLIGLKTALQIATPHLLCAYIGEICQQQKKDKQTRVYGVMQHTK